MKAVLVARQQQTNGIMEVSLPVDFKKGENKDQIIGTMLNELFGFMAICRKHKAEGLKATGEIDIDLKIGRHTLSTKDARKISKARTLAAKLRLGHTAKAKKNFATLLYDLLDYMTRPVVNKSFMELIEELSVDADFEAIVGEVRRDEVAKAEYLQSQLN